MTMICLIRGNEISNPLSKEIVEFLANTINLPNPEKLIIYYEPIVVDLIVPLLKEIHDAVKIFEGQNPLYDKAKLGLIKTLILRIDENRYEPSKKNVGLKCELGELRQFIKSNARSKRNGPSASTEVSSFVSQLEVHTLFFTKPIVLNKALVNQLIQSYQNLELQNKRVDLEFLASKLGVENIELSSEILTERIYTKLVLLGLTIPGKDLLRNNKRLRTNTDLDNSFDEIDESNKRPYIEEEDISKNNPFDPDLSSSQILNINNDISITNNNGKEIEITDEQNDKEQFENIGNGHESIILSDDGTDNKNIVVPNDNENIDLENQKSNTDLTETTESSNTNENFDKLINNLQVLDEIFYDLKYSKAHMTHNTIDILANNCSFPYKVAIFYKGNLLTFKAKHLAGKAYTPLYSCFKSQCYQLQINDFISLEMPPTNICNTYERVDNIFFCLKFVKNSCLTESDVTTNHNSEGCHFDEMKETPKVLNILYDLKYACHTNCKFDIFCNSNCGYYNKFKLFLAHNINVTKFLKPYPLVIEDMETSINSDVIDNGGLDYDNMIDDAIENVLKVYDKSKEYIISKGFQMWDLAKTYTFAQEGGIIILIINMGTSIFFLVKVILKIFEYWVKKGKSKQKRTKNKIQRVRNYRNVREKAKNEMLEFEMQNLQ